MTLTLDRVFSCLKMYEKLHFVEFFHILVGNTLILGAYKNDKTYCRNFTWYRTCKLKTNGANRSENHFTTNKTRHKWQNMENISGVHHSSPDKLIF